jgi:pSer/pThr/pTyr-binding forkhead associated (FHA) protein
MTISEPVPDYPRLSRTHAKFKVEEEQVFLVDQSHGVSGGGGTWVNTVPLVRDQPFLLRIGDRINLGSEHTVLKVNGVGANNLEIRRLQRPVPELKVDVPAREVYLRGSPLPKPLTPAQFDILSEMYNAQNVVVTFERITPIMPKNKGKLEGLPEDEFGEVKELERKRIREMILEIRRKIERQSDKWVLILTAQGNGYKMPLLSFSDKPPFVNETKS